MSFTTSYTGNELKLHATGCLDIADCETGTIWYGERPDPSLSLSLDNDGRGNDSLFAVEETWDTHLELLTLRRLMSYIYMEHPFLMFLDHTQRRSTVGRTPLDE